MRATRKIFRGARIVVAIFTIIAGILFAAYPPFRDAVTNRFQQVKEKVANALPSPDSPIRPVKVTASAQVPEHAAAAAFDVADNTHWAAPWRSDARASVDLDLGKKVALRRVIVTVGIKNDFAAAHRPALLQFAYDNGKFDTLVLKDEPAPQEFALENGLGVGKLHVEVLNVNLSQNSSDVALTELELFGVG
jgi:hypothetical protein